MLDQSQIAHYLLSLGLVKPRAVVEEDLTIVDASRRNCVYVATTSTGPTHVVKQALRHSAGTVAHEAAVLRALARVPALSGRVPTVVHHDAESGRLVLRSPARGRDWGEHHRRGRFPSTTAQTLGRFLGALHAVPTDMVERRPHDADPMWGLSLPEPSYDALLDMSPGACDVIARLQGSQSLCDRLRALRERVDDRCLVHGDLRWENCLAVARPGSTRRTTVLVVDWELAGNGAAAFDIGTVLAEYLRAWVGSIPIVTPTDPGRFLSHAAHPLSRMQPAVGAFWSAYRSASSRRPTVRQVIELTAVRLLQIAVERAEGLHAPTAHVVTLLQLADNMLCKPDSAAAGLLGLRE